MTVVRYLASQLMKTPVQFISLYIIN